MPSGIFGRDGELATVASFLNAAGGQALALVIAGEAGIGKTTLWRAALAQARRLDYLVLPAAPAEAESRLPFAGLGDLLADVPGSAWADLSTQQRVALDTALLRSAADGSAELERAISAGALSILRNLSRGGRLLVAIDDVQWLDSPTVRVLEFAMRRLEDDPIRVLLTIRGEELPEHLQRSLPAAATQRLAVGPLSLDAVGDMLTARLSSAFSQPTLFRLHESSGGNPFFALEIGRFILAHGASLTGGSLPVPENLHDLVHRRLGALSRSVRDALLVVSAVSQPIESLVAACLGAEVAADGLTRAFQARLLERSVGGRLRFSHPLIGSVLYEEAPAERRRQLHSQLANLVQEPEERARHLALGSQPPDERVAIALQYGAEVANARGAPDVAYWLMDQAVIFTPTGQATELLRRRLRSVDYQFRAGETSRLRPALEALAGALPSGHERAAVLQRLGRVAFLEAGLAESEALLERALLEVGDDRELRVSILRDLVLVLTETGKLVSAEQRAKALSQEAERLGDAELVATASGIEAHAQCLLGKGISVGAMMRARALAQGAVQRAGEAHPGSVDPLMYWGAILKWADDFMSARRIFGTLLERMVEENDESSLGSCLFQLAELECWTGNYDMALHYAEHASRVGRHSGYFVHLHLVPIAMVCAYRGDLEAARRAALEALTGAARTGRTRFEMRASAALGFIELSRGEASQAVTHLSHVRGMAEAQGYAEPGVLRFEADQIEALLALGRLDEAERLTNQLEERGRILGRSWAIATGARCHGLLLAARGDLQGALAALDGAIVAHAPLDQPFEHARTLLALGTVQRRAKQRRLARDSLERAAGIFDQLGTPIWGQRARAELSRIGGRLKSSLDLTTTERRVAELAAAGRTNREIARQLFITVRTVEANLSRIYGKLEVRSRVELVSKILSTTSKSPVSTDSLSELRS